MITFEVPQRSDASQNDNNSKGQSTQSDKGDLMHPFNMNHVASQPYCFLLEYPSTHLQSLCCWFKSMYVCMKFDVVTFSEFVDPG